jgi:hypothetical protein
VVTNGFSATKAIEPANRTQSVASVIGPKRRAGRVTVAPGAIGAEMRWFRRRNRRGGAARIPVGDFEPIVQPDDAELGSIRPFRIVRAMASGPAARRHHLRPRRKRSWKGVEVRKVRLRCCRNAARRGQTARDVAALAGFARARTTH